MGSLVWDVVAGPVESIAWETTEWVERVSGGIGGNGGTTAFTLGKLGASVRLMAVRGDDGAGEMVDAALRGVGVDCSLVERRTGATAMSVGLFHPDGRRQLLHSPGVGREAGFVLPVRFSHLHVANPFALPGLRTGAAGMLAEAKARGMGTSMDLGWDRLGEWGDVVGPCLPFVDVLFANEAEWERVGRPKAVVKMGARGCLVDGVLVEGFAVEAVDTTGAGDCFCGGFLAARERGLGMAEAARVANAVGALSVRAAGATAGLLDWDATVAWMDQFKK